MNKDAPILARGSRQTDLGRTYERFEIEVGSYPDGSPLIKWPLLLDNYDPYGGVDQIDRIMVRGTVGDLMAALFFVDALKDRGYRTPALVLPFVPGSRQDRLMGDGDFLFTVKSVAREINARDFPVVYVFDPHSDVTTALIDRCQILNVFNSVSLPFADAVIAPDAGAAKRAADAAGVLRVPVIQAWKKRDVATGNLSGFGMEPIEDDSIKHVLVVDDICDGGGTFIGLAEIIREAGLTADLFVTHGIFSKGIYPLLAHYRKVVTTDTRIQRYTPTGGFEIRSLVAPYI